LLLVGNETQLASRKDVSGRLAGARSDFRIDFGATAARKAVSDSKSLRRATLMQKVPCYTTMAGCAEVADAIADAIAALKAGSLDVSPLQGDFESANAAWKLRLSPRLSTGRDGRQASEGRRHSLKPPRRPSSVTS
jgi:acetyl-CoA acetyltransferase